MSAGTTTWARASLVRIVGPFAVASARAGSIAPVLTRSASLLATRRRPRRIPPGHDAAPISIAVLPRPRPNKFPFAFTYPDHETIVFSGAVGSEVWRGLGAIEPVNKFDRTPFEHRYCRHGEQTPYGHDARPGARCVAAAILPAAYHMLAEAPTTRIWRRPFRPPRASPCRSHAR